MSGRRRVGRLLLAGALGLAVLGSPDVGAVGQSAAQEAQASKPTVLQVQYVLRSFGYVVPVNGSLDARTTKAIRHFQAASGLTVDGIVGPITWAAMTAPALAVRLTPPAPAPEPQSTFAPYWYTGCAEMTFYRVQAGLPERFEALGWRESNCRNDVTSSTGCCVGYWQISTGNFTAPGYRDGIAACGVARRSDILGLSPLQKQKQACVAKVLYDVSGLSPWSV